jgi:hypothetical protein
MLSGLSVPDICPSTSVFNRSAASLHRVARGDFPDFAGTISGFRLLGSRPAALRCLRLAVPRCTVASLPFRRSAADGPGLGLAAPYRVTPWRNRDLPGSWGILVCTCPALRPRRILQALAIDGPENAAFRCRHSVGSAISGLSRLHHAAYALPVYASQPGAPPVHATLGTGGGLTLAGTGLPPVWIPIRDFRSRLLTPTSLSSRLRLAQAH